MRNHQGVMIALVLLFWAAGLHAAQIEGVEFNETHAARGATLTLRGVALLRYMVVIKAYVGALYMDRNQIRRRTEYFRTCRNGWSSIIFMPYRRLISPSQPGS